MPLDPYETLGVKKDDSKEKIKKAYRQKSLKAHPDQGGNGEEFDSINKAYRVLCNDENRARYDGGEDAEKILKTKASRDSKIEKLLADIFLGIIQGVDQEGKEQDIDFTDIFSVMKKDLSAAIIGVDMFVRDENKKIKKFRNAQKRIKAKKQGKFFHNLIENSVQKIERGIALIEAKKKDFKEALDFLDDFSYQVDQRETTTFFFNLSSMNL